MVTCRCCQAPLAAEAFWQPHLAPPRLDLALQLLDEFVLRRDLPGLGLRVGGRARLNSDRALGEWAHTPQRRPSVLALARAGRREGWGLPADRAIKGVYSAIYCVMRKPGHCCAQDRRADTTASTDNPIGLCAWHTTRGAASAAGICVGVLVRPARISQRQSAAATRKDLILLILSVSYPSGWWKARPDVVGYVLQSAAPTGPSPWFYWGVSSSPYVYFICCT